MNVHRERLRTKGKLYLCTVACYFLLLSKPSVTVIHHPFRIRRLFIRVRGISAQWRRRRQRGDGGGYKDSHDSVEITLGRATEAKFCYCKLARGLARWSLKQRFYLTLVSKNQRDRIGYSPLSRTPLVDPKPHSKQAQGVAAITLKYTEGVRVASRSRPF